MFVSMNLSLHMRALACANSSAHSLSSDPLPGPSLITPNTQAFEKLHAGSCLRCVIDMS